MAHNLGQLLAHYGLIAIFLLAFIKAIGVPIPIPIDVVVLAAATGSASGKFVLWQAFLVLLVAMVIGGCIQFALARGPGRKVLYRYGGLIGLTPRRLDYAFRRVQNVGILGVAVAVVTPGIRSAAMPACGLTTIPVRIFISGLALGTTGFLTLQFFVGYAGVKLLLRVWNTQPHVLLITAGIVLLALIVAATVRHRIRHSMLDETGVRYRSRRCPICWLAYTGDVLAGTSKTSPTNGSEPLEVTGPAEGSSGLLLDTASVERRR